MKGKGSTRSENLERFKEIIALAKRKPELSQREIAKELGYARNTVSKALAKVTDFNEEIELFRKQRGDILDEKQRLILSAITSKKVSEARLRDLAVSAGILFDKGRLERGLSTANLASLVSIAQKAEEQLAEESEAESANPVRTGADDGEEIQ